MGFIIHGSNDINDEWLELSDQQHHAHHKQKCTGNNGDMRRT